MFLWRNIENYHQIPTISVSLVRSFTVPLIFQPRHEKTCLRVRLKQACSATELARVMKFHIKKLEILFYPGSEQQRR